MTRVEVTMDGGETWQVCTLDHPENPNKYGKFWCWCFWSLEVEVLDLLGAKKISVRAWDETLNTQPEKLIWNVLVINYTRVLFFDYKLSLLSHQSCSSIKVLTRVTNINGKSWLIEHLRPIGNSSRLRLG